MKTFEEGDKLIAEFMELVENTSPYKGSFSLKPEYTPSNFTSFMHDNMPDESWYVYPKFHSSWDWLMPVVEKIENDHFDVSIYGTYYGHECSILKPTIEDIGQITLVKDKSKIQATWLACVNFIKWYNENSNQNEEK